MLFWVLSIFLCLHSQGIKVPWEKERNYRYELASRNSWRPLRRWLREGRRNYSWGSSAMCSPGLWAALFRRHDLLRTASEGSPPDPPNSQQAFRWALTCCRKDPPFQHPRGFTSLYLILPSLLFHLYRNQPCHTAFKAKQKHLLYVRLLFHLRLVPCKDQYA